MTPSWSIRKSAMADLETLDQLYPDAFPEEDLRPVVRRLYQDGLDVLQLVAYVETEIVGHVAFTMCSVGTADMKVALLAPLCVAPGHQKTGIGSGLVKDGFSRLGTENVALVLVLGDPNYYGRFGFVQENAIKPPCPIPPEWAAAWQSVDLLDGFEKQTGNLNVPEVWNDPALWAA